MILRRRILPLFIVLLGLFATMTARANLGSYQFLESTGERIDISGGSTELFGGYDNCIGVDIDDNSNPAASIGFTFRFGGQEYTRFSASTNGLIGLYKSWGSTGVSRCWSNALASVSGNCGDPYGATLDTVPQIAPLWDDLRVPSTCNGDAFDGSIHYMLVGDAPGRVLVIEYRDIEWNYYNRTYGTFQARLYEGSNTIEFWYGGFNHTSYNGASIGLVDLDAESFMSVTPGWPATVSTGWADDGVDARAIAANTLYTFVPCEVTMTPLGATRSPIVDGMDLLDGAQARVGSSLVFEPFMLELAGGPCGSRDYSFEITGTAAWEYSITPSRGTLDAGASVTPQIVYTPGCPGTRTATLRYTSSDGTDRTFELGAIALPQVEWTSDMSQGGTATGADGDTLLDDVIVTRRVPQSFTPLTIANANLDPAAPNAEVSFELIDPNGQYTIDVTSASLAGGEVVAPSITFLAEGVSHQEATLIVTTMCETRTYMIRAFSAAPAGELSVNGEKLLPESAVFGANPSCVGAPQAVPIVVTNTGYGDFILTGIELYRTDTLVTDGTPPFPLLRDGMGRLIPSTEYQLRLAPGPFNPIGSVTFPFAIPTGQTRTIYATFIGSQPGKRYVRAFISSNGQAFFANDASGAEQEGLMSFNLVARATGSALASTPSGTPLKPVVLPSVRLGQTSTATFTVSNAGACDLLIRRDKLRVTDGDVNEFTLVEVLPSTPVDAASNMYRIAPGATDRITVRFTPSRSGTRMATLLVQTNDSTIWMPGISERGSYRMDLHGFGRAGLDASELVLAPVLVGGTVGGVATLENSSNAVVDVRQIAIVGEDAAQFRASAALPWPAMPTMVAPGGKLRLAVELTPTGDAGARRAALEVITTTEDTILVAIRGEAGVARVEVGPSALFENVQIPVGQYVRQWVTITNNGTFPIRLQTPVITGTDVANYSLGTLPRYDLIPGQTEFLEVTFSPEVEGSSSAVLEIVCSSGSHQIQLGGASLGAQLPTDPTDGVSAITGEVDMLRIDPIRPNPTSDAATLGLSLAVGGDVAVTIHDGTGRLVAHLAKGRLDAGRHLIRIETAALPVGVYHVRITAGGMTRSTALTVTR